MSSTKNTLSQLRKCLNKSDIRYQTIVDKLATEILQCGIDYYNDSDDDDCATKAMKLQKYALTIAVGNMTKQRCKENVEILQKVIDNLPPTEVFAEDKAIREELRKYCLLPDKIVHAVTLLNNTKPYLASIKNKLGVNNSYYLKISTQIVGNALHNIIGEVNDAQSILKVNKDDPNAALAALLGLTRVKSALEEAWKATLIMDSFDMESEFKSNRYDVNRKTLKGLCDQLDVSTEFIHINKRRPIINCLPNSHTQKSNYTSSTNSQTSNKESNSFKVPGCLAYLIGVLIVGLIGAMVNGGDGFFVGCIWGLLLGGPLMKILIGKDE